MQQLRFREAARVAASSALLTSALACAACAGPHSASAAYAGASTAPAVATPVARPHPPAPEPSTPQAPTTALRFSAAKSALARLYVEAHPIELYCGCGFDAELRVDADGCGYAPRRPGRRAERVEWEHLMPAERFGRALGCWSGATCASKRGRECCAAALEAGGDARFRAMEGDLHNLAPAIGELNADRSNRPYGEVAGEPRDYGACDFEVDRAGGRMGPVELRPSARGDAARAWLYMADVYGVSLDPAERAMLEAWSASDPPDAWERRRNAGIQEAQGNRNHHVDAAGRAD